MRKEIFIFGILLVLVGLLSGVFVSAQSYNEGLVLEPISIPWQNIASGETRIAEIDIKNNTDYILDGRATLFVEYQGICSNEQRVRFEGEGIYPYFSMDKQNDWIEPESFVWNNGELFFSNFQIQKGRTPSFLKIKTDPLLCPGNYTLTLTLKGIAEEKEYITPPAVIGGGGGGVFITGLQISNESASDISENSATITWLTNFESTSRVIYSPKGFPHLLKVNEPPNYGYVFSTPEDSNKVTFHTVTIDELSPGTTYYFRCVSHASPPTIGREYSFTTLGVKEEAKEETGKKISEGAVEEAEEGVGGEVGEEKIEKKEKIVVAGGEIVSPLSFEKKKPIEEGKKEISEKEVFPGKAKPKVEKKPKGILNNLLARIGGFVSSSYILLIAIFVIALIVLIILRKRRKRKLE